jgi:hypothetical protein
VLKAAYTRGAREAFAKFAKQPALPKSIKVPELPVAEDLLKMPAATPVPVLGDSEGVNVDKRAADVGMAMSSARCEGPGAVRGEPADGGQRAKSVIDRAFQRNEDDFATSSMPNPSARVDI